MVNSVSITDLPVVNPYEIRQPYYPLTDIGSVSEYGSDKGKVVMRLLGGGFIPTQTTGYHMKRNYSGGPVIKVKYLP